MNKKESSTTTENEKFLKSKDFKMRPAFTEKDIKTELGRKLFKEGCQNPHEYLKKPLKEPIIADLLYPDLESKILLTDRVCHTLKAGKIYRFRVTAGVGNKKGVIGLGVGKHKFKDKAIVKAINQAKKNLIYLESETVTMDLVDKGDNSLGTYHGPHRTTQCKLSGTIIEVSPLSSDSITASKWGKIYCELAGYKRIKISLKKKSSVDSKINYYKGLHEALKIQSKR